jgi:hypothetical protein
MRIARTVRPPPVTVFGLLVLLGGPAGAQEAELRSRVPPDVYDAVSPLLEEARRDSIPLEALESKILEGVAKQVPTPRIRAVALEMAGELRAARGMLRAALPDAPLAGGEVRAAATAMRQGVPGQELVRLWAERPDAASLEIPLTVVGELARRGVEPGVAVDIMGHLVASGSPMDAAARIPAQLDLIRAQGGPPGQGVREALQSLNLPAPPRGPPPGRGPGRGGPPGG